MLHTGFLLGAFLVIVEMGPNKRLSPTSQFTEHLHVFLVSAFLFIINFFLPLNFIFADERI